MQKQKKESESEGPEARFSALYKRVFALTSAALLAIALYFILQPFFAAIAWALLAAFLLYPLHLRLSRRLRGRAGWSSFLLTMATLLVCVGPLTALGVAFARQATALLERI